MGNWGPVIFNSTKIEIQNAPYELNATAPKVLPARNSHIPANTWTIPPYASATASVPPTPSARLTRLAFNMLSMNVVAAKAARPSGPGLAGVHPTDGVGTRGAGATSASRRPG